MSAWSKATEERARASAIGLWISEATHGQVCLTTAEADRLGVAPGPCEAVWWEESLPGIGAVQVIMTAHGAITRRSGEVGT